MDIQYFLGASTCSSVSGTSPCKDNGPNSSDSNSENMLNLPQRRPVERSFGHWQVERVLKELGKGV